MGIFGTDWTHPAGRRVYFARKSRMGPPARLPAEPRSSYRQGKARLAHTNPPCKATAFGLKARCTAAPVSKTPHAPAAAGRIPAANAHPLAIVGSRLLPLSRPPSCHCHEPLLPLSGAASCYCTSPPSCHCHEPPLAIVTSPSCHCRENII